MRSNQFQQLVDEQTSLSSERIVSSYSRHCSITSAVRHRKNQLSNIWIFDSPKNDRRFIIKSDLAFMHCVLFEGDTTVKRYDLSPPIVTTTIDGERCQIEFDVIIYRGTGIENWCIFKRATDTVSAKMKHLYSQLNAQEKITNCVERTYRVLTDIDLAGKEIFFDNWLMLCAAITRAKNQPLFREARLLDSRLQAHRAITVGTLLKDPESDEGLMLALIAKTLQLGAIQTDLEKALIGKNSIITRSTQ